MPTMEPEPEAVTAKQQDAMFSHHVTVFQIIVSVFTCNILDRSNCTTAMGATAPGCCLPCASICGNAL